MKPANPIISEGDFVRLMAMQPPPELRAELERAIVIPLESMQPNIVSMQSRVCYQDVDTGTRREIEIVFPDEADISCGKVSVLAPVGAALIGLTVGQQIEWQFPDGSSHRLEVVEVIPQQQHRD